MSKAAFQGRKAALLIIDEAYSTHQTIELQYNHH